jgi:hypothetical protein
MDTAGSGGAIGNFNWLQLTATSVAPTPPAPSNLLAQAISSFTVNLSWQDNSTNETGFIIERKTGTNGAWGPLATVGANVTSLADNTVAAGATYVYRVRATNAAGDSANSNESTATTPPLQSTMYVSDLPFAGSPTNGYGPVELDESNGSSGAGDGKTITLNGVTYTKGLGVHALSDVTYQLNGAYKSFLSDVGVDDEVGSNGSVDFQVFADGVLKFDSGTMTGATGTKGIAIDITGAQQLRLHVTDAGDGLDYDHADWAGARVSTNAITTTLAAPTNLAASAAIATQVKLTWQDNAVGETGYKIERSTDGVNFTQIGTVGADTTIYYDGAVSASTSYTYRVRATTGTTDSGYSNNASITTPAAPATTYISDMQWVSSSNGWGPVERDQSVGGSGANDGSTLVLNGVSYSKGIGTNSPAEIIVNLNKSYATFTSDIGVDDHQTTNGSVTFQVYGDGVLLYDSGLMGATTATKTVSVNVANVAQLRLVVTDGGDGNAYDWADWAGARLLPATQTVTAPTAPTGLGVQVSSGGVLLSWVDTASNEDGFRIERSTDNVNFTEIATVGPNVTSYGDANRPAGTYYYRVRAYNSGGTSVYSNVATAVVTATKTLPGDWLSTDIGTQSAAGTSSFNSTTNTFTVAGAGTIGGTADSLQFAYESVTGDHTIVARVASTQNTSSGNRAGIMFRESLAANSREVGLFLTAGGGIRLTSRTTTGGSTTSTTFSGSVAPYWLKLTRAGNVFSAYRSANGVNWTLLASVTIAMPATTYMGLAVSSGRTATLNTATFDNVSIL